MDYPKVKVKLSSDNGLTFNQVGELPQGCYTVAHNISSDEDIYIWCDNGEIYNSLNKGVDWHPVHKDYQITFDEFSKYLKVALSKMRKK